MQKAPPRRGSRALAGFNWPGRTVGWGPTARTPFAAACLAASGYGFLQGAWPFGLVELIWSGIALRRWLVRRKLA